MYLASVGAYLTSLRTGGDMWADFVEIAMGTLALIRRSLRVDSGLLETFSFDFSVPYYSISVSLNVLLTLMIVIRLVLHCRNVGVSMGSPYGFGGIYKTTITMLVESSALYAVSSVVVVAKRNCAIGGAFVPILCQTQVRALPRTRSLSRSSDLTDLIGHRFAAHHQTGREPERVGG